MYLKEERKKKARFHSEKMKRIYNKNIKESIDNSEVFYDNINSLNENIPEKYETDYIVDAITTEEAIIKYDSVYNKLGVLNFASYTNPGGGFINGAIAQEEALCHASTLYNVLSDNKFKQYYEDNIKHKNNSLYRNFAIYSPNIVFSTNAANFVVTNVLTCPAPNLKAYLNKNNHKRDIEYAETVLQDRIKFILDIFNYKGCDTLILGAFGCGVFGNNPNIVATIFKKYIERYNFKKVIFAIPPGNNYDIFKNHFS